MSSTSRGSVGSTAVSVKLALCNRNHLSYIISMTALLIFFTYIYRNAHRYLGLLDFSPGGLLLLVGLVLVVMLSNGSINYLLYRGLKVRLSFQEGIGLAAINTLANQLPFAGGMIAKGVYLKKRHRLAYTYFLSATVALYILFVTGNGLVGIASFAYLKFIRGMVLPNWLILGFSGMIVSISLLQVPLTPSLLRGRWSERIEQLLVGKQLLHRNRLLAGKLVTIQVLSTIALAGRFWIAFRLLSQDVTLAQCILFASASILTQLVTITPGGLGVRELIVASIASVLGMDIGISMVAVGLDRIISTTIIAAAGSIYTYHLSEKLASSSIALTSTEPLQERTT